MKKVAMIIDQDLLSFNEDYTWSFGKNYFAPVFHTEKCNTFKSDWQGFDWESKFCDCGYIIQ